MQAVLVRIGWIAGAFLFAAVVAGEDAKVVALKQRLAQQILAAPNASDKVKAFAVEKLLPLCTNEVFVKEVQAHNDRKTSLSEIRALDAQWREAEDKIPLQTEKLGNPCAEEARKVAAGLRIVSELFVMDNQGANVGQNHRTTDYWQGDEPKWKNSYNAGQGGVDIGDRRFDKSANVEDQKVSLPIIDTKGEVIGAVCFGLKADSL